MTDKSKRIVRRGILIFTDIVALYGCALFSSYAVFANLQLVLLHQSAVFSLIIVQILFFLVFRLYFIRLVDSSLDLVVRGAGSMFLASVVIFVLVMLWLKDIPLAIRFTSTYIAFTVVILLGYRVIYRMALSYHFRGSSAGGQAKTLIYGAGEIGLQLARQFFKNKLAFKLIGFIDDNPEKHRSIVGGLTVLGGLHDLPAILRSTGAEVLILAITDLSRENMRLALDTADKFGVETKIVPSMMEMEEGRKSVADIRSINFEDLLGRNPISFDKQPIANMIKGKRVLITGAGGSIGNEIARQMLSYSPSRLFLLDIDETELHDLSLRLHTYRTEFSQNIMPILCDVRDAKKIERLFSTLKPEIVFHAAANKHVPMMEYYPEEAYRTNVGGTYNVLSSAIRHQVTRCIVISTDKAVNPTNVMGATKRIGEMIGSLLSTEQTEIISVRFGNVLGSRGSVVPLFLEQMRAGLPITVTDRNIVRYFMTVSEAVSLVSLAGALGKGKEVMVLDMGEQVNIYDFAKRLVKYFGDGKSEVVITGLRPGEKLYEEKLNARDKAVPTNNPKLFKALVNGTFNHTDLDYLVSLLEVEDNALIIKALQKFVPEFEYKERPSTL